MAAPGTRNLKSFEVTCDAAPLYYYTMPGEIYNANPTLYTPSRKSTRKSDLGRSIWFGDEEDDDSDSDQVEPIDRDEVFGKHTFVGIFRPLTTAL